MSLLRPNTVKVERPSNGLQTRTGGTVINYSTIYTVLPCLVDALFVAAARLGNSSSVGPLVESTHVLYADGIKVSGYAKGAHVTSHGVSLIVSPNLRGAFPDIQRDDKITLEDGRTFLVLQVALYYDIYPNIQAELAEGKA